MILIDARSIENKKPHELKGMLSESLPSKIIVFNSSNLPNDIKSSLKSSGALVVECKEPFIAMASTMKRFSKEIKKVYSNDPLAFSFFSFSEEDFRIEMPENRKVMSRLDAERSLDVDAGKVIDLFFIIGNKQSNIPAWLPTSLTKAVDWIKYKDKNIIESLMRDENSPAREHPLFYKKEKNIEQILKRRKDFKKNIRDYVLPEEPDYIVEGLNFKEEISTDIDDDLEFSIDKLNEIINECKENGPLGIYVKENRSLSFLGGKSNRLEISISSPSGKSCVITKNISDNDNNNAWSLLCDAIKDDVGICTNDAKSIYKAAFYTDGKNKDLENNTSLHDINAMAFALDNRNLKLGLNKLYEKYKIDLKDNPAKSLISLFGRIQYEFNKPGNEMNYKSYMELDQPIACVIAKMELKALPVNNKKLGEIKLELNKKRNQIAQQLKKMAHHGFNPDNPDEVIKMLFETLKLPVLKKTPKGKPSYNEEVLSKLNDKHPFIPLLREYRKINTLINNSIEPIGNYINPYSGKIHYKLEQLSSQNGRMHSVEPNVQGMPGNSELSNRFKESFEPDNNEVLISLDYKQAESYMLASLSGESRLQNIFNSGIDIHLATAAEVFNCNLSEVTDEQRNAAKAINFGLVYGMTEYGISKKTGITTSESRSLIKKYFNTYPTVENYLNFIKDLVSKNGFVFTLNKRKIYIEGADIHAPKDVREKAIRSATNAPMQGSVSDLIKKSMINLSKELSENSLASEICLQVHDEIIIQCPRHEVMKVISIAEDVMTKDHGMAIDPKVDIEIRSSLSKSSKLNIDDFYIDEGITDKIGIK